MFSSEPSPLRTPLLFLLLFVFFFAFAVNLAIMNRLTKSLRYQRQQAGIAGTPLAAPQGLLPREVGNVEGVPSPKAPTPRTI